MATAKKTQPAATARPTGERPFTLCFDIGGTGLKASVLDAAGEMVTDRVRIPTPYPLAPPTLVSALADLAQPLPKADRASAGFPGMVRAGVVLTAPSFSTVSGTGSAVDPELVELWHGFNLAEALQDALKVPTKVANDADVQSIAVVSGKGLELTVTLGTGFGTGLLYNGTLLPHLEIAHLNFRKNEDFDHQVGEAARKRIGNKRWTKRVFKAIKVMRTLTAFDHLYIGGGNAQRLPVELLPEDVTVVPNSAGIFGGIRLWDGEHIGIDQPVHP
jgi:polyphosphate glucokinase